MRQHLYGHEGPRFVFYWWFVGWWAFSLGMHIDVRSPNIELHLPFGFLRIGRRPRPTRFVPVSPAQFALREFTKGRVEIAKADKPGQPVYVDLVWPDEEPAT